PRTERRRHFLRWQKHQRRSARLPAPPRLRPRGAQPLSLPFRPRISATGWPAARNPQDRARSQDRGLAAIALALGRSRLPGILLFEGHAAKNPSLGGSAP